MVCILSNETELNLAAIASLLQVLLKTENYFFISFELLDSICLGNIPNLTAEKRINSRTIQLIAALTGLSGLSELLSCRTYKFLTLLGSETHIF